jgi:hypothetical protein
MGKTFFFIIALISGNPKRPDIYKFLTPNSKVVTEELDKILSNVPKAKVVISDGMVNNYSYLTSKSSWFTDDGNVYFTKRIGNLDRISSIFKGKYTFNTSKISGHYNTKITFLPNGTMVLNDSSNFYFYNPSGELISRFESPLSSGIREYHSPGNGGLLVHGYNFIYFLFDGKIRWRKLLNSYVLSSRYYGVSENFLIQLGNGIVESRSWETGKLVWSMRLFGHISKNAFYGYLTNGNVIFIYNNTHVKIISDKTGKVIKSFKMPWLIKNLYLHPYKNGFFVTMENNRLGFYDLNKNKFLWLMEMGTTLSTKKQLIGGNLIVKVVNRIISIKASGNIAWMVIPPQISSLYNFIKMPGGNLAYITQRKIHFIYPPNK